MSNAKELNLTPKTNPNALPGQPTTAAAPTETSLQTTPGEGEVKPIELQSDPRIRKVGATLERLKKQFTAALPKHLDASRFFRVVLTTLQRTPKLLECAPESFMAALLQCAALGLEPDGLLGQAYLIPFKVRGEMVVQFIPGYRGLIKLVRQSGEIAAIYARVVYEKDRFSYAFGLDETLTHVPYSDGDPGAVVAVYAVARFKGGEAPQFDVMRAWEVDKIRDNSQGYRYAKSSGGDSPWTSHYPEMAKKTALRRLCKNLPQSIERDDLARAVALDEAAEAGIPQMFDTEPLPQEARALLDVRPGADGKRVPIDAEASPAVNPTA